MSKYPSLPRIVGLLRFATAGFFVTALTWAADVPTQFAQLDLLDGRRLNNVTVRSYDPASERVLLIADRKAMTVPITLIPPSIAQHFVSGLSATGESTTVVPGKPAKQAPAAGKKLVTPKSATPIARPAPMAAPVQAHVTVASERARRYFRYERPSGSNAIRVINVEIEIVGSEQVAGWEGRYRTKGKAYIQYYDSGGRSYNRQTDGFEVITEQTPGQAIVVIDLSRLAHTSL